MQRIALVLVAICLILPARSSAAQTSVTARILSNPIANLDPVALPKADLGARDVVENLFMGLVRYNALTNTYDKALAKDWTISPDGLTWTFTLRDDVQWVHFNPTSGQVEAVRPVTAGDFVYGIRRACDPTPPGPAAPSIFIIAGCATIANANPLQVNDVFIARNLGARASGTNKLEITFAFPAAYIPALLAQPEFRPVAREAVTKSPADWAAHAETILTNGPFALKSFQSGGPLALTRNPSWPDAQAGNVTDVLIDSVAANGVNYDMAHGAIPGAQPAAIQVLTAPASVTVLGFSAERPGMSNPALRQALSLAVDRSALTAALGHSEWVASSRFMPISTLADNTGFDPAAAKAALATTSMAGCNRLPDKFEMAVDDQPESLSTAETLLAAWNKVLGCNTTNSFTVRAYDPARLRNIAHGSVNVDENQQGAPRPHMWIITWTPDYVDPNAWSADALHCNYGFLHTGVGCGASDNLLDQAGLNTDEAARLAAYQQADTLWFTPGGAFPVAPLYTTQGAVSARSWLSGVGAQGPQRFDVWTLDTAQRGNP